MSIRVYLHTSNKRAETPALLDSGATENFINHRYATHMQLLVKKLPTPRKVFNIDGTPNKKGDIQFYTDLEVRTGQKNTNMRFFLTDLGPQRMILGYPWFAAVQPKIDWAKGWIDYAQLPVVIKTTNARRTQFTRAVKACGQRMKLRVATQTKASQLAEQNQNKTTPQLPKEYQRHAQVFSEQRAQRFPESRPWDHAIELKKDAPSTLPGKIYSLTQSEQKALQEFIKEHLQKGYIRPSKSPYAAPFFFIKKKDGKLRPVQDYRRINEWTIKNRYPLPLIPELINRVKGATLFSKFDVRWGYNNVRIKKGDEWKAAFITNQGLFEPRVMFFGLTNSPATFQTMMNEIFQEELREGWVSIYMDDILIHTDNDRPRHRKCVHRILDKLKKHDLYLKPEKCLFEQEEMEFLGVVLKNGTIQMDPTKIKGVADWPRPNNVRDVRAFLGFTGFYRYFIPNYSKIARPLIDLTRKATPFHWEPPQMKAFETLKTIMCRKPILRQPNYDDPFFLLTDASAYGVGAVLSQEGETNPRSKKPFLHPIAYYSSTFIPAERNYDIYERELLAVLKSLEHWRPHLAATEKPVTVLTDHANLAFWKNPKKVNRRVARWFATLQDYHLRIKHVPGKQHAAPDMLSRRPDADKGEQDNLDLTLLPPELFIRLTTEPSQEWIDLEKSIARAQKRHLQLVLKWKPKFNLTLKKSTTAPNLKLWLAQGRLVIPPNEALKREILYHNHGKPTTGHPGRDQTIQRVAAHYWWPGLKEWVANYVKGCAPCQQNKILTHRRKVPLFHIPAHPTAFPFQVVAMDLITQLPKSDGADAILTIVDQGCTRAAVFLPCSTTITGEGVAKLYLENVYRWFGLPTKIISDRDPRFTSHFAKALCEKLQIKQNISTAFHPQTDGLSERKNQWIEQFLRLTTNAQQDEWKHWLPVATAVHNNNVNATTKVTPAHALLGYLPTLDPLAPMTTNNERVEDRLAKAKAAREQAQAALDRVADQTPEDQFQEGERVWLEAKNLALPYQTRKLAPKRHGPFTITKRVSPVAYQLGLPPTWTIHDVFHASLLTQYKETAEHGTNFHQPPPEMVDGEEEYEVQAIMGHRFFGKRRKLQYLVRWKGYSAADDTWETADQVFAPQLLEAYHRKHPKSQPFPHKRGAASRGRLIRSSPPLCLITPATPLPNRQPLPTSTSHSRFPHLRSPSRWTQTLSTMSPRRHQPLRRHLRSPSSRKDASPPDPPSPSSKPSVPGAAPTTSGRLPRLPPAPSSNAPRPMRPPSDGYRTTSPSCEPGLLRPPSPLEPIPGPMDSSQTTAASPPSTSPTWDTGRLHASSGSAPPTPPWRREPWEGPELKCTPTPSKPALHTTPPETERKTELESPSPSGSWTSYGGPRPPSASSSAPAKAPATGDYPPTSHDSVPPSTASTSCTPPEKAFSTASTAAGRASTSSPAGWVGLRRRADLPTFSTLRTLSRRNPETVAASKADAGEVGSPVVGLRSNRRVMSRSFPARPLPSVEHSYLFCPKEDPAEYHAGCFCKCSSCAG